MYLRVVSWALNMVLDLLCRVLKSVKYVSLICTGYTRGV